MNAKDWRKLGWKTIFRDGLVYLYNPGGRERLYVARVDGGRWMEADDLVEPTWHHGYWDLLLPEIQADIVATAAACYCDQGVDLCDFCAGIRPAPREDAAR